MKLSTLLVPTLAASVLVGCQQDTINEERYGPIDETVQQIEKNIEASPNLASLISIDHSRLASAAGKPFPPTKVVMFQDPVLEAHILTLDSRLALNLPLKVLVYENEQHGTSVVWNSPDYLEHRFNVHFSREEEERFHYAIASALEGVSTK
ncbi:DUF302 domain-containing protein, partial [Vibrio mediterranei]|uniref:DUF302 domain-containing protein n=1 Tax=Vibrio mediterranei TaxID=689 RepID=UPI00148C9182